MSRLRLEHRLGRGGDVVGLARRRAGRTSAANSVTTSTSICSSSVGRQVEACPAPAAAGTRVGACRACDAGAGELPVDRAERAEPGPGGLEDHPLGGLAQAEPVERAGAGPAG